MNLDPIQNARPNYVNLNSPKYFEKWRIYFQKKSRRFKFFFLKVAYNLAHQITFGKTSKKFKAKAIHLRWNLYKNITKKHFGDDFLGNSRNVARYSVIVEATAYQASKNLLQQCRADKQAKMMTKVKVKIPLMGICSGINLDIAERYLIKHETINEIIASNQKGASAEAIANQTVFSCIDHEEDYGVVFLEILQDLMKMKPSKLDDPLFFQSFTHISLLLTELDPHLKFSAAPVSPIIKKTLLKESPINDLLILERKLCEKERKSRSAWLGHAKEYPDSGCVKNVEAFQKAASDFINRQYRNALAQVKPSESHSRLIKKREDAINTLKWVTSYLEFQEEVKRIIPKKNGKYLISSRNYIRVLKKISDPTIRSVMKIMLFNHSLKSRYQVLARARGLKLESLKAIMGDSSLHASNVSYLQNLSKLEPGVYSVIFRTLKINTSHAITYFKIDENRGYLLDPNNIQIQCGDAKHTFLQFQKLLSFYKEPFYDPLSKFAIFKRKNRTNNLLIFHRFTKI
ncbi:hypothetical protein pah_c178o056 [Parachlamydia acanthamoebae str. Hall's coccus]|nr:hypothetical protein pah_c178o056 [Parachlamydia acanthamoebae str. Hall's coccus]